MFKALLKTKDYSPANIKSLILNEKNFKGIQNDFEIDEFGDNTREYLVFRVVDGKLVKVEY